MRTQNKEEKNRSRQVKQEKIENENHRRVSGEDKVRVGLLAEAKRVLARISDVQEPILVLVFFINGAHQSGRRWQDLVHEDEYSLLWG